MRDEAEHHAHPEHDVILYGSNDAAFIDKLLTLFADSLERGEAVLVMATAAHQQALRAALDAHDTLESLMVGDRVDRERFLHIVGDVVRPLADQFGLIAYGEMSVFCGPTPKSNPPSSWSDVIMCSHANLHSTLSRLGKALQSGMRTILGDEGLPVTIPSLRCPRWAHLPEPESTILWLRENLPQHFAAPPPADATETNP